MTAKKSDRLVVLTGIDRDAMLHAARALRGDARWRQQYFPEEAAACDMCASTLERLAQHDDNDLIITRIELDALMRGMRALAEDAWIALNEAGDDDVAYSCNVHAAVLEELSTKAPRNQQPMRLDGGPSGDVEQGAER